MADAAPQREWTPEQMREGVLKAIGDREFQAAVDILTTMVRWYPREGVKLHDEIQESLVIARFLNGSGGL